MSTKREFLKQLVGMAVAPLVPVTKKSAYTVGVDLARDDGVDAMRYVLLAPGTDGRARIYSYHASADGLRLTLEKLIDGKEVAA